MDVPQVKRSRERSYPISVDRRLCRADDHRLPIGERRQSAGAALPFSPSTTSPVGVRDQRSNQLIM